MFAQETWFLIRLHVSFGVLGKCWLIQIMRDKPPLRTTLQPVKCYSIPSTSLIHGLTRTFLPNQTPWSPYMSLSMSASLVLGTDPATNYLLHKICRCLKNPTGIHFIYRFDVEGTDVPELHTLQRDLLPLARKTLEWDSHSKMRRKKSFGILQSQWGRRNSALYSNCSYAGAWCFSVN